MIEEKIPTRIKEYHVRGGDAVVFGQDAPQRREMSTSDCEKRFADIWQRLLEPHLQEGEVITYAQAEEILDIRYHSFLRSDHEQRQFHVDSVPFLAQISDGVCGQLWSVGKHRDPTRLSVHFRSAEFRERFVSVARQLGRDPDKLAEKLLCDFTMTVEGAE